MAAPLNEIFMKAPLRSLSLVVLAATAFQPPIAQANPSPLVRRSDSAVKMLRSFHDRLGCAPQIAEKRSGFTRHEITAAVSACSDRVNELIATATSDSLSHADLENLQQLRSTFSLEDDQIKTLGLQSLPVFAPNTMGTTAQLEALERNQFSHTTKSETTVVFPENSNNPKSIAQANPSPLVKRSDAIFQQWTSVRDKFGCVDLPWTPIANPGFTRYEMAAAINACFDRVSELVAGSKEVPFASPDDLKMLEPLMAEFAEEIATLRGRVEPPSSATPKNSNAGQRTIVVYTESGRVLWQYEQFAARTGTSGEYIDPDYDPAKPIPSRKPAPRPIDAWIVPALKDLQSRYGCPNNNKIQITNPSVLSSSRYEVAAIINACAEEYHKRGLKLRKIDADDFLNMQRLFPEELVTLQERNREVQRQRCLAQPCEEL
jgi:hypothetical protein